MKRSAKSAEPRTSPGAGGETVGLARQPELALADDGFDPLDHEFAGLLRRMDSKLGATVARAAMLLSRAVRAGHLCLDLRSAGRAGGELRDGGGWPEFGRWRDELLSSVVVGKPGEFKPLILDAAGRLYLQRYWTYETEVLTGLRSRLEVVNALAPGQVAVLNRYFGPGDAAEPSGQRRAVETALTRAFSVISGGPGTGKTFTIALLVGVLAEAAETLTWRVALAAPTGKAAVRLEESLLAARVALRIPVEVQERMPAGASTLHRLLGAVPGSSEFRHDREHPLPFDLVVVDEASMVDVAMMAKLLAACRPTTRLVLVGDMDQLASVEAGAVLGDICAGVRDAGLAERSGSARSQLENCIVRLRVGQRFRAGESIDALSRALNAGEADVALGTLESGAAAGLGRVPLPPPSGLASALHRRMAAHWREILGLAGQPKEALRRLGEVRVLCALRRGPYGVDAVNAALERAMKASGTVVGPGRMYPGRPILIRKNDYQLRLFNGDVGLILPHPETGEWRAWFLQPDGQVRDLAPGRLPEHETSFALTVHQSQGSEFQEVMLVLPDRDSPVLTRELIYTGVTRARRRVEIWLSVPVFRLGLARRTARASGLAERLWSESEATDDAGDRAGE